MTDFDKIYHIVEEMNSNWRRAVADIRTRQRGIGGPDRQIPVVDDYETQLGSVTLNSSGELRAIDLDPYEVSQSNEHDVLSAIRASLNVVPTSIPSNSESGVQYS